MDIQHEQGAFSLPISTKNFAKIMGVSVKTLQRWDRKGILIAYRTPTNRRYYTYEQATLARKSRDS